MTPVKQLSEAIALMSEDNLPKNPKKREKLMRARSSLADLLGRLTELELIAKRIDAYEENTMLLTQRICT